MKDYKGAFNPNLDITDLDHGLLAQYGREIMVANHIHDRGALIQVALTYGQQAQTDVAIDEWMASSPIYNERVRSLLKIVGDDVSVALKALQVDIGAPHNFLHFQYELVSPEEGYFWSPRCGPYNHVRALSNADPVFETQICHHMEDTTFDATVMAVNSRMRCTPVHRPPHDVIPDRGPCKWMVSIQRDIGLVEDNPYLEVVVQSLAASFEFETLPECGSGMEDYSGELKRDFRLDDLSHNKLATVCKELMLDVHLLNRACYTSIADRWGEDAMLSMEIDQWRHMVGITVHRLRKTFGIEGEDMSAILKVLQLNPFLPWDYLQLAYEQISETEGRVWLRDCTALEETQPRGITSLLTHHPETPGFGAMAAAVNPHAQLSQIDHGAIEGARAAWKIVIDPQSEPATASEYDGLVGGADLRDLDNSEHHYSY